MGNEIELLNCLVNPTPDIRPYTRLLVKHPRDGSQGNAGNAGHIPRGRSRHGVGCHSRPDPVHREDPMRSILAINCAPEQSRCVHICSRYSVIPAEERFSSRHPGIRDKTEGDSNALGSAYPPINGGRRPQTATPRKKDIPARLLSAPA